MIIIVDDEKIALDGAKSAISSLLPDSEIKTFSHSREALAFVEGARSEKIEIEIAFLDIMLPVMNGVELAQKIKVLCPICNIIFTTGFDNYYSDAFLVGASDYLLKPITPEKVKHALDQLRNPINPPKKKAVSIQCFGNFEIFLNGVPLRFKRLKSKEFLAYLVSRGGAAVTKNEIMANIFEKDDTSYYGVLKKDLTDTLDEAGVGDILIRSWKSVAVDRTKISCDYFDFLDGHPDGLNSYVGEFMSQYSWAEFMNSGYSEL